MLYTYSVVTPAYNEARLLPRVIEAVSRQWITPVEWVIVDDNSTDATPEIIREAADRFPWIRYLKIERDRTRRLGANVVQVVSKGFEALSQTFDFWVKLDADIMMPEYYFAFLLREFNRDPGLGMASGKTYFPANDSWVLERCPDFHVMGACQMFRKTCFQQIGGLIEVLGWDYLDVAKARSLGWTTRSYQDLPLFHFRQMGSVMGMAKTFFSYGRSSYITRSHPVFVLGRAVYRAMEKPYLAGLMMVPGYLVAWFRRETRIDDLELARFLRAEQRGRVLGRKLDQEIFRSKALSSFRN